jgi:hypothetical protein
MATKARASRGKLFFGLVLCAYGLLAGWIYWSFELHAVHVDAKVDSVRREVMRGRRGGVNVYRPVVPILTRSEGGIFPCSRLATGKLSQPFSLGKQSLCHLCQVSCRS